jgi:pyridoxamine 5'-phosphate oxidase
MIEITNINDSQPYSLFKTFYENALSNGEENIEAILISSFDKEKEEVDARYVNLKYISGDRWIFFTNYKSPKSIQFQSHNQITAVFYWKSINLQIRIKANIFKTSESFSNNHFINRAPEKNALAISSNQSETINSYNDVINNYEEELKSAGGAERPKYWGGYSFTPYCMEFWEGHPSRLNKRQLFQRVGTSWELSYLQP